METTTNIVRTVDTYDDTPVTISIEEYRQLLRANEKVKALRDFYDMKESFYFLAGRILEIYEDDMYIR